MDAINRLKLGDYEFAIEYASFRYITQSWSGPGWDFSFSGPCLNNDPDEVSFMNGVGLLTEAAPLPIANQEDLTGVTISLPLPYDEESGEPYFGIYVWEEHDVSDVVLRFAERSGNKYRIEFSGTASKSALGQPTPIELNAWAERLPDHAYPV